MLTPESKIPTDHYPRSTAPLFGHGTSLLLKLIGGEHQMEVPEKITPCHDVSEISIVRLKLE
jgi:hypothetical protein